jgi:hypothetical protein
MRWGMTGTEPMSPESECDWFRLRQLLIELVDLNSLGAFTDEHYCGPAVTGSMHSDDTHSQMWV